MRKALATFWILALLTPSLLFGQGTPSNATSSKDAKIKETLMKLENDLNSAILKNDADAMAPLLADDLMDTDPDGTVQTKEQFLADVSSGNFKITSLVNDEYQIHVYGNSAVLSYRLTVQGQFKGQDISGRYRNTDTWIKSSRHWQCVAGHYSKIADEK